MVDNNSYPGTGNCLACRVRHGALGPDGPLEEGQENVRDGVDGPDSELVTAAIHSGPQGEATGLAFGHIGGAQEVCP